jgi:hypothetical protein
VQQQVVNYGHREYLNDNRVFFSDTNGNGFISMSEVSQAVTLVEVPIEASGRQTTTCRFQRHRLFGMAMQGSWLSTSMPKNKYRHNGIEQTASASGTKYRIPKLKLFFG